VPSPVQSAAKFLPEGKFDEMKAPDITMWRLTRSAIEHENTLVNHRITWLMTSQGVLLAAFALIFLAWAKGEIKNHDYLIPVILGLLSLYGIYLCLTIHRSLHFAHRQLGRLHDRFKKFLVDNDIAERTPPLQYRIAPLPLGVGGTESLGSATLLVWLAMLLFVCFGILEPFRDWLSKNGMIVTAIGGACLVLVAIVLVLGIRIGRRTEQEMEEDIS
jgi:hypothetical protein